MGPLEASLPDGLTERNPEPSRRSPSVVTGRAPGIMPPMSEHVGSAPGPSACPFVAFEDERDERSSAPDARHRCFAELRPAHRSTAHQDAYCLSSAFPACPTFQDWVRREGARARDGAAQAPAVREPSPIRSDAPPERVIPAERVAGAWAGTLDPAPQDAVPPAFLAGDPGGRPTSEPAPPRPPAWAGTLDPASPLIGPPPSTAFPSDPGAEAAAGQAPAPLAPLPQRGPIYPTSTPPPSPPATAADGSATVWRRSRRDWAAPPPWASDAGVSPDETVGARPGPGAGLAASAASWLGDEADAGEDPDDAPAAADAAANRRRGWDAPDDGYGWDDRSALDRRRDERRSVRGRSRGPAWEEPPPREVFPSLRTRLPAVAIPRSSSLTLWFVALIVAAAVLFFVPPLLLRLGGVGGERPTATPAPATSTPAPSVAPTPTPAPTPQTYVIAPGDSLARVARRFGVTLEELLAANPQITDKDLIRIGDEIVVPPPKPDSIEDGTTPTTVDDAASPSP